MDGFPRLVREAPRSLEGLPGVGSVAGWEQGVIAGARAWWDASGTTLGEPTLRLAKGFLESGSALVTVVFLAFFLLLSGPELFRGFLDLVPSRTRAFWRRLGDGVTKAVGGYVMGKGDVRHQEHDRSDRSGLVETHVLTQAVYHGTVKLSLITIAISIAIGAELGGVAGSLMETCRTGNTGNAAVTENPWTR